MLLGLCWVGEVKVKDKDSQGSDTNLEVIKHEFYSKPMATRKVIDRRSALPMQAKKASLTQEVVRRLLNCDRHMTMEERGQHVTDLMQNMVKKYMNMREGVRKGERRSLYRTKEEKRSWKRIRPKNKAGWYKNDGDMKNKEPRTIMLIPYTKGGELARNNRQAVEHSQINVKVAETGERTVRCLLQRSNPTAAGRCKDKTCQACDTELGKGRRHQGAGQKGLYTR